MTSPLPADPKLRLDLMRRFAVVMFVTGGITTASGFIITAETDEARATQAIVSAVFIACGLIMLLIRTRRWMVVVGIVISILNVGALVAGSDPLGMGPMGYLWPVAFTAYFFPRRMLLSMCVLSTASLTVGLALNDHHDLKLDSFVGSTASVYVVAGMMSSMNRREDVLRTQLEVNAGTDPLTGLLNRRGFAPLLTTMITPAAVARTEPLAFVMFDLDRFKQFNDERGHLVGDDALCRVAEILRRQAGRRDAIARFGGEEFAVAMPGASATNAAAYATRVATALQRDGDPGWNLTVSAGIAVVRAGDDALSLASRADEALYAAKRAGRDRAAWFDDSLHVGTGFTDSQG